jgi:SH3-like domain-containing protein
MRGIPFPILAAVLITAVFPPAARSLEYRTVESAAVLYDTPSLKGAKLFVIHRDTPVEIIVDDTLEAWAKVRDSAGTLAWIEKRNLGVRRTLIVKAERAVILKSPTDTAPLSFEAERNVSLDYLETVPGGWIKVRHRDGQEGYVRVAEVWGF